MYKKLDLQPCIGFGECLSDLVSLETDQSYVIYSIIYWLRDSLSSVSMDSVLKVKRSSEPVPVCVYETFL